MNRTTRIIAAAVLCLLFVGLIALGRFRFREEPPALQASALSAESCRECHAEQWRQWQESSHARAWSDPNIQAAFQHFGFDRKCESCHSAQPILVTGLGKPVELRTQDQRSGVNCLTCHQLPGGGVAALHTIADAPCRPTHTPALSESRLCGSCHEAIFRDWQASRFAKDGKNCRDCHTVADANGRLAGHCWTGRTDSRLIRSSCRIDCRREKDQLIVAVTNDNAGHNFPGERHNRVLLVQVIERNPAGEITLAQQQIIKRVTPFRGESSAEKIKPGETCEFRFPIVELPATADVQLLYKAFPWYSDHEALVVHETHLELKKP